jgi:hypothetical protein
MIEYTAGPLPKQFEYAAYVEAAKADQQKVWQQE